MECPADESLALANFTKLPPSHQMYYSKWIEEAKTTSTLTNRIAKAVNALSKNMNVGAII